MSVLLECLYNSFASSGQARSFPEKSVNRRAIGISSCIVEVALAN